MQNAPTRWKIKTVSLSVTIEQLVWLLSIQPLLCKWPESPRGNSLDSRGRSHPAILTIWERINFQKSWIGGRSHHMCLNVPLSPYPSQWLSGLSSNVSLWLLDIRDTDCRESSGSKSSFIPHLEIDSITFAFNFAATFSVNEVSTS